MPKGTPKEVVKECEVCAAGFKPTNNYQRFCSRPCRRKIARTVGAESTDRQYELITGNWNKYFNRLCSRSFNRAGLNAGMLITLLEQQNGKCALSGVELTCTLQKGIRSKTNASIDRINPKGEYTVDNIQLVCSVINKFRIDTPLDEFIDWCRKVAEHAVRE